MSVVDRITHKELTKGQEEKARAGRLAGQTKDSANATEDLSQTGEDQDACEEERDCSRPKSDINGNGWKLAQGECKEVRYPITVGVALDRCVGQGLEKERWDTLASAQTRRRLAMNTRAAQ